MPLLPAEKKKRTYNAAAANATRKLTREQQHEWRMELLKTYQKDPDLFYKLGVVGGGAVAIMGVLFDVTVSEDVIFDKVDIFPDGLDILGLGTMFGGMTFSVWCAGMLTVPKVFGEDGIQARLTASGWGAAGEMEIG